MNLQKLCRTYLLCGYEVSSLTQGLVLVLMAAGGVYAALPTPSLTTQGAHSGILSQQQLSSTPGQTHPSPVPHPSAAPKPGVTPTKPPPTPGQGVTVPPGWAQDGLSQADALEAAVVASTFTQREMLLDYRNVGTRTHHAGTFTAAFSLLTPAAQQRFLLNDKRSSDAFFEQIEQEQLIQLPINLQGTIVQVQQRQGKTFAWVTVSFQLVLQHGAAGPLSLPVKHSLSILLVREPLVGPANAQVGSGIGWLVSNYVLDSSTLAALLSNP